MLLAVKIHHNLSICDKLFSLSPSLSLSLTLSLSHPLSFNNSILFMRLPSFAAETCKSSWHHAEKADANLECNLKSMKEVHCVELFSGPFYSLYDASKELFQL